MTVHFPEYPITSYLDEICSSLKNSPSRFMVLTAETAAGKSTLLPLALLQKFEGKIIMTEPRRLAVLGVANRLSDLSDTCTVGYKIHLESHITKSTRLEVVTEAILVRQLQEDPALENYNVVVLDEFHERSINTDLALAFLKEAMQLRDDLYVVIMSATIDTAKLQAYLAGKKDGGADLSAVPLFQVPGRNFPVKMIYEPEKSLISVIRQAMKISGNASSGAGAGGNILVFLPGIADIRRAKENLDESGDFDEDSGVEVCVLHSSISLEEQKRVISDKGENQGQEEALSQKENHARGRGGQKRRIILSSAIAETSLTVPGVSIVIDSGLARVNRLDLNTGMEKLCTENESEFSATQRAGRAGRLGPGTCFRLWAETDPRQKELAPEILRTDLVPLVLECSERGVYSSSGLDWLDAPSPASWRASSELLRALGMIREDARITDRGRAALKLGLHPRLAGIALDSFVRGGKGLDEVGRRLLLKFSTYSKVSAEMQRRFISDLERRLSFAQVPRPQETSPQVTPAHYAPAHRESPAQVPPAPQVPSPAQVPPSSPSAASTTHIPLILSGYPDRLARRLTAPGAEKAEYQFAGGRKALLSSESKSAPEWLVAPEVLSGKKETVIFEFEEISEQESLNFLQNRTERRIKCEFQGEKSGKIQKTEEICYGAIVLSSRKLPVSPEDFAEAWINEISEKGLSCLPLDEKTQSLLLRAEFLLQQEALKSVSLEVGQEDLYSHLQNNAREWLIPFLSAEQKTSAGLSSKVIYDALFWYLQGQEIDTLAPETLILENGRRCRVIYEKQSEIRPVIEIIIQRIFGCKSTPQICGKKVLFRLLSPASRPLQVTEDLEGFWKGAWPEICREMKGRYPKHNWNPEII